MANTILTPTAVTREALRVLHQKLNFVGNVTRGYDDQYAKQGAKIGSTLNIRLPNQYTVRKNSATLSAQDTTETSVALVVSTQDGVDLNFTSADLTLSLDDFTKRILNPAMSVLAASIEGSAMAMAKDVYNRVSVSGAAMTFNGALRGRKALVDNLAPVNDRNVILNTQHSVDLVDALKGLFQPTDGLAKQYREGYLGRMAGFDWMENTILPNYTNSAANGAYLTNGATQTGASLIVDTGANAPSQGDVFTIAGVFRVHPETKVSTGVLQTFVVGSGATAILWPISPAIVATGGRQNVSNSAADNSQILFTGAGTFGQTASSTVAESLCFQEGAFAFATADLIMPDGVDFSAREVQDGISIRIVRQYDINNDKFPCRLDVMYGFKTIRPELAVRLFNQ